MTRIGYLGPNGTFTEEALRSVPELAALDAVPMETIPDVLNGVEDGDVELGIVAIENAIEGSVNVTTDTLAFDTDLLIQREVVLDVHLHLLAAPGTALDEIHTVLSFPVALAQCRQFLRKELPDAHPEASTSTAGAVQALAADPRPGVAAVGPALAGELYGLDIVAHEIEDHPENQTRFVVVGRDGVPAPTGHDKTSIVVYQRADVPGSLMAILQGFAARAINLSRLESRPTKRGLGDYCFLIDLDGHISDEVVAHCLREIRAEQADVKFLGSYPAALPAEADGRRTASAAWQAADAWLSSIRRQIEPT